jgi:SgrR family transcriptional regulator
MILPPSGNHEQFCQPADWHRAYSVSRNNSNQLKIRAFDDYFGYRALIDEVNVWVLPDLSEDLSCGLTLEGPTTGEKAVESRLEEGCYYLLFDAAPTAGQTRRSASG